MYMLQVPCGRERDSHLNKFSSFPNTQKEECRRRLLKRMGSMT